MRAAEQRAERPSRVGILKRDDPDFKGTERRSITLPPSWLDRADAVGEAIGCDRFSSLIQWIRWSVELADPPPLPEGTGIRGPRKQTISVYLPPRLWKAIEEEAELRGESVNRVFQAHLLRALAFEEADNASARKAKR